MATANPFDLLGDDENDDPSQLIGTQQQKNAAQQQKIAAEQQKIAPKKLAAAAPAKLPSRPLPPQQSAKLKQRQNHEKLIAGKSFALNPGDKYFLVPSSWLSKWRAYVTTTRENISSLPEPENLEAIVDSLICQKHSRLIESPLELVCKRGVITQKPSTIPWSCLASVNYEVTSDCLNSSSRIYL